MDPIESPPSSAAGAIASATDSGGARRLAVRHRLPRRYRRRPARSSSAWSSWLGWLLVACLPAAGLLMIDRLDLRAPASQDFVDAQAMLRDLVQRYQNDAYTRPEAKAVIARLERVPSSSRNYAEAQDLLRRYRWETERAQVTPHGAPSGADSERPAAELEGRASDRPWPDSELLAGVIKPARRAAEEGAPTTTATGAEEVPFKGAVVPSGWKSIAPSKSRAASEASSSTPGPEAADRELAARIGLRCYTSNFGAPTPKEAAGFELRMGTDSSLRLGGLRVRSLRDLREAAHRLVTSDAALEPLDRFLSSYSEDVLSGSEARFEPGLYLVLVDADPAVAFVDLLKESARCNGKDPERSPANSATFAPGIGAGKDAISLDIGLDRETNYALRVRMPRGAGGDGVELWARTPDRSYPVCRFPLPGATRGNRPS